MATLWVKTTTYESVEVGDDLPILVKHESQETIDSYAQYSGKDLGPRLAQSSYPSRNTPREASSAGRSTREPPRWPTWPSFWKRHSP